MSIEYHPKDNLLPGGGKAIDVKALQPLLKKSQPALLKLATKHFNAFIRNRDSEDGWFTCISCGMPKSVSQMHAGHYMSAGHHSPTRFDEDNCHGQCIKCNTFLSANLVNYRKNLIQKIGLERVQAVELKAREGVSKLERLTLAEIILRYR